MSEAFIDEISARYIELFEKITGEKFVKANIDEQAVEDKVNEVLKKIIE
jgi:phosphoribosylaminoimidazole-succinocarboxamide synthase